MDFKSGLREKPELIKVYEKISRGIWSYKGFFELIDANIVSDGKTKGVQVFAEAGREEIIWTRCRTSAQSIDSDAGEG